MDPRASFKIVGEQIDGAFSFEGTVLRTWSLTDATRCKFRIENLTVQGSKIPASANIATSTTRKTTEPRTDIR